MTKSSRILLATGKLCRLHFYRRICVDVTALRLHWQCVRELNIKNNGEQRASPTVGSVLCASTAVSFTQDLKSIRLNRAAIVYIFYSNHERGSSWFEPRARKPEENKGSFAVVMECHGTSSLGYLIQVKTVVILWSSGSEAHCHVNTVSFSFSKCHLFGQLPVPSQCDVSGRALYQAPEGTHNYLFIIKF